MKTRLAFSPFVVTIALAALGACVTHPSTIPVKPAPIVNPSTQPVAPVTKAGHQEELRRFKYTPGTYAYNVTTSAKITSFHDTSTKRLIPTTAHHIKLSVAADGNVQLANSTMVVSPMACDSAATVLRRAKRFFLKLPEQLAVGSTWSDSVTTSDCHASTLITSTIISGYKVLNDTTYNALAALHIQRLDTIIAQGEETQGQHRVFLAITSTDTTDIYFDVTAGQFLGAFTNQIARIDVTTSGRTKYFTQHITEDIALTQVQQLP